jgi:hypothetical protein
MAKKNKWKSPGEILGDVGKSLIGSAEEVAVEEVASLVTGAKSPEQALQDAGQDIAHSAEKIGEEQVGSILSNVVAQISGSKSKYEDHAKFDKFKKGKK